MILKDELNRAINLWIDITGVDPNKSNWNYFTDINDDLKEAQELDPSGLTVQMMLKYYVEEYLSEKTFTPNEMINNPNKIKDYIDKCVELKKILDSDHTVCSVDNFKNYIKGAIKSYGGLNDDILKLIDSEDFAFIRRDALRGIKELSIYQFLQGENDSNIPKYNEYVYEFWNVNSLIDCVASQSYSGVSLVMIKTEEVEFVYFGFVIRNGGTITLITDKPSYPHPDSKYMRRSRGRSRDLEKRVYRLRFPYSILDSGYNYNDDFYVKEKNSCSLIPHQTKFHPIKKIIDLEPDELIWSVMMFDLIVDKFWNKNYKTKELSYTGEMFVDNKILINNDVVKSLPVKKYCPIDINYIKSDDVNTQNMIDCWENKPTFQNEWMEKRYCNNINNELLNIVHNGDRGTLFLSNNNKISKKGNYELRFIDPSIFGTKDELIFNQKWVARYNKASYVLKCANEEYIKTKDSVINWYKEHVKNNENIMKSIAFGEFYTNDQKPDGFDYVVDDKNILKIYYIPGELKKDDSYYAYEKWSFKDVTLGSDRNCYITGRMACIAAVFRPSCPLALADLAGVNIDDLPDVLQNWYLNERYSGNSILYNVDPMEWVVDNPWRKLKFNVVIFLSKTGYNELRKKYNLKSNKFWFNYK